MNLQKKHFVLLWFNPPVDIFLWIYDSNNILNVSVLFCELVEGERRVGGGGRRRGIQELLEI